MRRARNKRTRHQRESSSHLPTAATRTKHRGPALPPAAPPSPGKGDNRGALPPERLMGAGGAEREEEAAPLATALGGARPGAAPRGADSAAAAVRASPGGLHAGSGPAAGAPLVIPSRPVSAADPGSPARKWTPAPGARSPAAAGSSPAAPRPPPPPAAAGRRWPGPCQLPGRGRAAAIAGGPAALPPSKWRRPRGGRAPQHRLLHGGRRSRGLWCLRLRRLRERRGSVRGGLAAAWAPR